MTKGDAAKDYGGASERAVHGFEPSYSSYSTIRHYHGDIARDLLLGAAALSLIASPLYADSLKTQFPLIIAGVLASAVAAGLTDPKRRISATIDAVVSGVALVMYAGWALVNYSGENPVAFVLRMAIAIIFFFAFYFSMKTVRAFSLGEVGAHEREGVVSTHSTGNTPDNRR